MADGPVTIELDIDNGKDDKNLKKVIVNNNNKKMEKDNSVKD